MKKRLIIFMMCIIFVLSSVSIGVLGNEPEIETGLYILCNGENLYCSSLVYNNTHYVPIRPVFEKMGARVFYRASDRQILALTRDGDMIRHILGENVITINGEQKVFDKPSIIKNDGSYIPVDMIYAALCPQEISCDNGQLNIIKPIVTLEYHKPILEIMEASWSVGFTAENFQRYINYHTKVPSYSVQEVVSRVNIGLDYPFHENVKEITNPYELLVLVNKYNKLPSNFEQYNLVKMSTAYASGSNFLLAGVAYDAYIKMADDAKNAGLSMRVVSAHRTENYQRSLYNSRVASTGKYNADRYSAQPGFSEHQTGLAVDINSTKGAFEYTNEFKWLCEHAHEYGFILRYPKGKEWITGYAYEPWHYRYVGIEVATIIHEEDITYEEFYAKYIASKEFK